MVKKVVKKKVTDKAKVPEKKSLNKDELRNIEMHSQKKHSQGLQLKVNELEDKVLSLQVQLLERDRVICRYQRKDMEESNRLDDETYALFFNVVKKRLELEDGFSYNPWTGEVNESKT